MKKFYVLFTIILGVCLISCGSAPKAQEEEPVAPVVEETPVVQQTPKPAAAKPAISSDEDDLDAIFKILDNKKI